MTLVIVAWHPLSDCKIQGVGLLHTPGVGASHSGSSAPSSRRTKPPFLRRLSPKRARSGCVVERLSHSRCSRSGRCQHRGPNARSFPASRVVTLRWPTWSLRVFLLPTTPIPTTKKLAIPGRLPSVHPGGTAGPEPRALAVAPKKIAARELSLVGAGALETGAGANPAGRQAAGELVAPAGRAATPPPPRFKGQPGGGIFERRSLRSLRLEAQRRQRRGFFGKIALVPPPSGAAAGNFILSGVSPPLPAEFRRSHRGH